MSSAKQDSAFAEFALTDAEAFAVAAAKLWLMQEDRELDPDADDRRVKKTVIQLYALELHRAFQQELSAEDVPEFETSDLIRRTSAEGWPAALRRAFGDAPFEDMFSTMTTTTFVTALLKTVTSRERAVLVAVELASFYPWPRGTKFEKDVRKRKLAVIATAMPKMTPDFMEELDGELRRRARNLSLRTNWKKVAAIGGGGAVLGLITGGLAAPLIGGAIGGAMGLSGAAAVNAGLATLGGGSLAAGGFGMAGGAMFVAGVAGVGAGAVGASGTAAYEASSSDVFAAAVKIDVLTEYMLVRGKSEPAKVRAVVAGTQEVLDGKEADVAHLKTRIAKLERLAEQVEATQVLVVQRDEEIDDLKKQLKDKERSVRFLEAELHRLTEKASAAELAA